MTRGDSGYLDTTELTAELPVSDLSPCQSNQIRMTVMLSQEFFPYLKPGDGVEKDRNSIEILGSQSCTYRRKKFPI